MKEVIEYVVVEDYYLKDFVKGVNNRIELGYEPFGSFNVLSPESGGMVYVQAMVFRGEE